MKALLSIIVFLTVTSMFSALTAEEASKPMAAVEKSDAARKYSIAHPDALGVFVNLAADPEIPEEQLMSGIKGAFAEYQIEGNFQVNHSKSGQVTRSSFSSKVSLTCFH